MGSMYRVIMKEDPAAALLREAYSIRRRDCGRYRDIFMLKRDGQYVACLLTRNGEGGYNEPDQFTQQLEEFTKHALFRRQYSDPMDPTYVTTEFKVPESMKPLVHHLEEKRWVETKHKLDSLRERLDKLRNQENYDPEVQRLEEWGKTVFHPMMTRAIKMAKERKEGKLVSSDGELEVYIIPDPTQKGKKATTIRDTT